MSYNVKQNMPAFCRCAKNHRRILQRCVRKFLFSRSAARTLCFLLLATLGFLQPRATHAQTFPPLASPSSLTFRQLIFAASRDTLTLALPDSFIITRSDTLRCGQTQFLRGRDYDLHYGETR